MSQRRRTSFFFSPFSVLFLAVRNVGLMAGAAATRLDPEMTFLKMEILHSRDRRRWGLDLAECHDSP